MALTFTQSIEDFHHHGYCCVENIFPCDIYDELYAKCMSNYEEIRQIITERNLPFGVGLKEGYDEIVQRHPGRYEVTYKMKNIFQVISEDQNLLTLIKGILGDDITIANESLLISESGTLVW